MKRFQNILFFAEGESEPSPALRRAFRLAETNHARLTLVDVVEPIDTPGELRSQLGVDLNEVLRERRLAELDALTTSHKSDETLIYTEVLSGTPFIQIIRAVKRRGYDLVIKAARGRKTFQNSCSAARISTCCASAPVRYGSTNRPRNRTTQTSSPRSIRWHHRVRAATGS